jgi:TP901 family phage tail tape measure protein
MSLTGGIALAPLKVELKANIAGFKSDMSKAAVIGSTQANAISKSLAKTAKVGATLSTVGTNLTKFVSLPLAAVAFASTKMALDFGNDFAKVTTLLDDGVVNFEDYKDAVIQGSTDSKIVIDDYTDAVYQSISAGVDQTEAIKFTTEAMDLARGGFTTGALAVDILTTAINGYKLKTEDATEISDMLVATQNAGKTTVDELASSMGKVIPIAASVNFGMEELSASYAQLTFNGIATAEAGTYLKSMLSELGKAGSITDKALRELSGKGFAELKAEGVPTADVLNMLSQYAEESGITLKDMFGSVEAGTAALVLASEDGEQYNEFLAKIEDSAGSTQAAVDKLDADPLEQLKGSMNELKNAGIEMGGALAPVVSDLAGIISDLAHAFTDLDESQQSAVINTGLFLIALGPVIKIAGGAVTLFTKLAPLIGGVNAGLASLGTASTVASAGTATLATEVAATGVAATTASAGVSGFGGVVSGVLGGSIATATVAVAAFSAAIGGVAIAGVEAYKQINAEVVPEVDIFTSKMDEANQSMVKNTGNTVTSMQMAAGTYKETAVEISEATKGAVGAYFELDEGAYKSMMSLYLNGTTITQDIANDMTSKYAEMGQTINASLEADYSQRLTIMQGFFDQQSTLSEADQTQILGNLNTNFEEQKLANISYQEQINAIYQLAANEHRKITEAEQQEINTLQGVMKINAVNTLSQTEAESAVILGRIKDQDGRMTAEMASEHVKALEDQRVKSVDQANQEYAEKVAVIEQMRDELGVISAEQADTMIADAERQKTETINAAQATKDDGVEVLKGAYDDLENTVNVNTGEILSNWERAKQGWNGWNITPKEAVVKDNTEIFRGNVQWAKDWWNTLEFETKYAVIETVNRMTEVNAGMDSSIRDPGNSYVGLSYVPYDGYMIRAHKGETLLDENEASDYRQGNTTKGDDINQEFNFYGNVDSPYQVAKAAKKGIEDLKFLSGG